MNFHLELLDILEDLSLIVQANSQGRAKNALEEIMGRLEELRHMEREWERGQQDDEEIQ